MEETPTETDKPIGRWILVACALLFIPPFFVEWTPPHGPGVWIVLGLRAIGLAILMVIIATASARLGAPRILGIFGLLGLPGLAVLAAIPEPNKEPPKQQAPRRVTVGGVLMLWLLSPWLLLQCLFIVAWTILIPIAAGVFLHVTPVLLHKEGETFPFFFIIVVIMQGIALFASFMGGGRLMWLIEYIRLKATKPVE